MIILDKVFKARSIRCFLLVSFLTCYQKTVLVVNRKWSSNANLDKGWSTKLCVCISKKPSQLIYTVEVKPFLYFISCTFTGLNGSFIIF